MSSDQYRRTAQQIRDKIANLQKDNARQAGKAADHQRKISDATAAASRTSNASTMQSKLREAERAGRDLANTEKEIARIQTKIADEHRKLGNAEKSLAKELDREAKKRAQDAKRLQDQADRAARKRQQDAERLNQRTKRQLSEIDSTLGKHNQMHNETKAEIEKIKQLPEKIAVLFLASNPVDQAQLRLDEEARSIQEMIRKSEHRDSVEFASRWAVRPMDVMQSINEVDPTIVHFSGHGSDRDEIVFQDEDGASKTVSLEAITQVMKACSGKIRLVFFNTCHSKGQAESVVEHVEAAVGMNTSIGDAAARIFSSAFYAAIGFGKSVHLAFEQGKAALMLEGIPEEDTPELFVSVSTVAEEMIVVRPKELADE